MIPPQYTHVMLVSSSALVLGVNMGGRVDCAEVLLVLDIAALDGAIALTLDVVESYPLLIHLCIMSE